MTILEAIQFADDLRDNAIGEVQKARWLNELEMKIQSLILHTAPQDMIVYGDGCDFRTEMLVPKPFDNVYYLYLAAMIDFANGEYDKYQNDKAMADAAYNDYAKWFHRHFHDDKGNVMYIGGTTKYGLSAYEIALNHGFEGTEEEWLESLKGEDAYTGAVEKGYQGSEGEFYAQLGVLNGIEERVNADAAAATAARDAAAQVERLVSGYVTSGLNAARDAETAKVAAQTAQAAAEKVAKEAESASGLPAGGSAGDVLTKTEEGAEWKAVDAPSGGGGATWELLFETTTTEPVLRIETGIDLSQYNEIFALCESVSSDSSKSTHFDFGVAGTLGGGYRAIRVSNGLHGSQKRRFVLRYSRITDSVHCGAVWRGFTDGTAAESEGGIVSHTITGMLAIPNFWCGAYEHGGTMLAEGTKLTVYGR